MLFDERLIDELVQRELQKKAAQERVVDVAETRPTPPTPLDPKLALILGTAADATSTYAALRQGTGREGNPAFQHFNRHPWTVFPTMAAVGAGYRLLHELMARKSPKFADTMGGLIGGYHANLGKQNLDR